VFLTPHTCAISPQVRQAVFAKFMRSLKAWEAGGMPEDPVDLERGY
jgi:phosphoglycerate dehydrogenase-like enzyme